MTPRVNTVQRLGSVYIRSSQLVVEVEIVVVVVLVAVAAVVVVVVVVVVVRAAIDKEATLACTVHQSPQQCICSARKELLRNTGCYSTSNDEVG